MNQLIDYLFKILIKITSKQGHDVYADVTHSITEKSANDMIPKPLHHVSHRTGSKSQNSSSSSSSSSSSAAATTLSVATKLINTMNTSNSVDSSSSLTTNLLEINEDVHNMDLFGILAAANGTGNYHLGQSKSILQDSSQCLCDDYDDEELSNVITNFQTSSSKETRTR